MTYQADGKLVALSRAGQKSAFTQLIERYRPMTRRLALGCVGNEDTAEELVQEAWLQAYLSLDHLAEPERFRAWLCGIVRHVCQYHLRAARRTTSEQPRHGGEATDDFPRLIARDPQLIALERERDGLTWEAVQALSPPNRDATILFYYEQRTVREIAAILGISAVAVKGRLHRARQQLGAALRSPLGEETTAVPKRTRRGKMIEVEVRVVKDQWVCAAGARMGTYEDEDTQFLIASIMSLSPFHVRDYVGLLDKAGRWFLPLRVGRPDVEALLAVQGQSATERSMSVDLMVNLVRAAGSVLEEVQIDALAGDIHFAMLTIRQDDRTHEVKARPSDAIAMAIQLERPVRVAEAITEQSGWDISDAAVVAARLRQLAATASWAEAAKDPWAVRIADGIIGQAVPALKDGKGNTVNVIVFEPRPGSLSMVARTRTDLTGRGVPLPPEMLAALTAHFKSLAGLDVMERNLPQHGEKAVPHGGREYTLQVSTAPGEAGEKLTLRLEDKSRPAPPDQNRGWDNYIDLVQ